MSVIQYTPDINNIIHNTSVDFISRSIINPIHLMQYDYGIPLIAIDLYSNGLIYDLQPDLTNVNIRFKKPDRKIVYNLAKGYSKNSSNIYTIYFETTIEMTNVYGECTAVVEIIRDEKTVASSEIKIIIDKNPVQNNDIISINEVKTIYDMIQELNDLVNGALDINIEPVSSDLINGTVTYRITYNGNRSVEFIVKNGEPFRIYKTYPSISDMNADIANIPHSRFVLITSDVEDPDNSKLYVKTSDTELYYLGDFSGAKGIQGPEGPKGDKGDKGDPGEQGPEGQVKPEDVESAVSDYLLNNPIDPTIINQSVINYLDTMEFATDEDIDSIFEEEEDQNESN